MTKNNQTGICTSSMIPLRIQPSDRSEMVSQLLFGETFDILDYLDKWALISCHHDHYEGWIDRKMVSLSDPDQSPVESATVTDICTTAIDQQTDLPVHLVRGSLLPDFNEDTFRIGNSIYRFTGNAVMAPETADLTLLEKSALAYINSPYLWGGRSPFGLDCSGFVQVVYRMCGIALPRDANQQVNLGETINFIHESQRGDLAFFDNENSEIVHVGIILGDGQLIHASGHVRIDSIDHHGIFNGTSQKYSHHLRIIKRLT